MPTQRFWMLCAACALSACAGNGEGLDANGRPEGEGSDTLEPSFESIQDNVFTPVCTGCHAGAAAPLGLRLDEGASYALLVNAPSVEVPALRRVQPGNPDASYLIQKLEGTAAVGGRMPLNAPALPPATIAVIRQWIANGAPNIAVSSQATKLSLVAPADGSLKAESIVVAADGSVDLSLLQAGVVTLRASGGDGNFESGNEINIAVAVAVRSTQPAVLVIETQPLARDSYELRINGGEPVALADHGGVPVDGDGDGMPGGDFVAHFTVEEAR